MKAECLSLSTNTSELLEEMYLYSTPEQQDVVGSRAADCSACISVCLCFWQCEVCDGTLGHMKAGDSMWIYKRMVHCENCFEVTRGKNKKVKLQMKDTLCVFMNTPWINQVIFFSPHREVASLSFFRPSLETSTHEDGLQFLGDLGLILLHLGVLSFNRYIMNE